MEHTDFHKIFQTLIPIAIFIFWALISRPAKKRKKEQEALERKRRAQQREEQENRQVAPSPEESVHEDGHRGQGTQTWKRTLDDILGEMGVPMEREEPEPRPIETPRYEKARHEKARTAPESKSLEEPKIDIKKEPKLAIKETIDAPIVEGAYTLHDSPITSKTAYALGPSLAAQSSTEDQRLHDLGGYSAAELQRLMVWSEVLGKPLALRENE